MLGLILIYFIGKAFYKLAEKHDQKKWLFAILGVIIYYGMTFIGGVVIIFLVVLLGREDLSESTYTVLGILGIPIGLLATWLFYYILRKNWEINPHDHHPELFDN